MNIVDAKPLSNNCEGVVLVNNLLERYSSCKKLQDLAWILKIRRELLGSVHYKVVKLITM